MRAVDRAGFTSSWSPAVPDADSTVKHRPHGAHRPTVSRRLEHLAERLRRDDLGHRLDRRRRRRIRRLPVPHLDRQRQHLVGARSPARRRLIANEGQTLVQFRCTDAAGNASAWTPASAAASNTVKIDRTAPTDPAAVNGGSLAWSTAASVTRDGVGRHRQPGQRHRLLPVPHVGRRRLDLGRSRHRQHRRDQRPGRDASSSSAPWTSPASRSDWFPAAPTRGQHRPPRPDGPHRARP